MALEVHGPVQDADDKNVCGLDHEEDGVPLAGIAVEGWPTPGNDLAEAGFVCNPALAALKLGLVAFRSIEPECLDRVEEDGLDVVVWPIG